MLQINTEERGSAGANKDSVYFQPAACLGQQDLGVGHRWVVDIQGLWAPWDSSSDWSDESRSHQIPVSDCFHQVIRGKEGYQGEGHIRLLWLVEVKLCNTVRIHVRVLHVLHVVLTNSPNSCPPERLFSIFNATYNDDQKRSHTDYIQLSM
jgi:hypothetical protein